MIGAQICRNIPVGLPLIFEELFIGFEWTGTLFGVARLHQFSPFVKPARQNDSQNNGADQLSMNFGIVHVFQ